jgi:hypothetical protein
LYFHYNSSIRLQITPSRLEILIAVQLVETPKVPYHHTSASVPFPPEVTQEATRLATNTLSHLPLGTKTDVYIINPLYDAQYALLQILEAQRKTSNLSDLDALLATAYHLYFAVGPRGQPPHVRILDLIISHIRRALLPFLDTEIPTAAVARGYSNATNNIIAWSLALGTTVSACLERPEHKWLSGHFRAHVRGMGLGRDKEGFWAVLGIFPTTEGYVWLDMERLWAQLQEG